MKNKHIKIEFIIVKIGDRFIKNYEIGRPSLSNSEPDLVFHLSNELDEAYRFFDFREYDREVLNRIQDSKGRDSVQFYIAFKDKSTNELKYYISLEDSIDGKYM